MVRESVPYLLTSNRDSFAMEKREIGPSSGVRPKLDTGPDEIEGRVEHPTGRLVRSGYGRMVAAWIRQERGSE